MRLATLARHRQALRWLWAAALAAVVAGSVLPADAVPLLALGRLQLSDKLVHFFAYAVLAWLPALHERVRTALAIAVAVAAMGLLLEFVQLRVAGRVFEAGDIAANAGGAVCGLLAGLPWRTLHL